jgi:L-malate glycosyltransferase
MIVFAHLLNDRSGSPKVLAASIEALMSAGHTGCLFVGSEGEGCLDDTNAKISKYWYRRSRFRIVTLITYLVSQVCLLVRLLVARQIPRNSVIYVNTLLPFGAAIYGRLTGRPVIYHLHEVSLSPALLLWMLSLIARRTAVRAIYVSEFHRTTLPLKGVASTTIYNPVREASAQRQSDIDNGYFHRRNGVFTVLMLASLRSYKGIPEFMRLADAIAYRDDIRFNLVLNEEDAVVTAYLATTRVPPNVAIFPRVSAVGSHYKSASLVLNLSRPDQWIETFGLTLVEAMAFGVPVIAPPVGGPRELVVNGEEGFLIDSRDGEALKHCVLGLADDELLCHRMSEAGRRRAQSFSYHVFAEKIRQLVRHEGGWHSDDSHRRST